MANCLCCLRPLKENQEELHLKCRRSLFGKSRVSLQLKYAKDEIIQQVRKKALRMSLGGAQPKASLGIQKGAFEVVDYAGTYLLKPSTDAHPQISENEHFCMNVVGRYGLPIPALCLVTLKGEEYALLIKRFDREGKRKVHIEDYASVLNLPCDSKYGSSYQEVAAATARYCRDSGLEKLRIFQLITLSYVLGNNDLHLKNFSLIDKISHYELSPIYDVLSAALYYPNAPALALDLLPDYEGSLATSGYYQKEDFMAFAQAIKLPQAQAETSLERLKAFQPVILELLSNSYLKESYREKIAHIISEQYKKLFQ